MSKIIRGSCLCGSVAFELRATPRPVILCHCIQCRKTSGHYVAATQVDQEDLIVERDSIRWYKSSEAAERAFCSTCGSNLFWRRFGSPKVSVFAGLLDGTTGLEVEGQLYPESAGDYYALPEVPVLEQSSLK